MNERPDSGNVRAVRVVVAKLIDRGRCAVEARRTVRGIESATDEACVQRIREAVSETAGSEHVVVAGADLSRLRELAELNDRINEPRWNRWWRVHWCTSYIGAGSLLPLIAFGPNAMAWPLIFAAPILVPVFIVCSLMWTAPSLLTSQRLTGWDWMYPLLSVHFCIHYLLMLWFGRRLAKAVQFGDRIRKPLLTGLLASFVLLAVHPTLNHGIAWAFRLLQRT